MAVAAVMQRQRASVSMVQRVCACGFNQAARLLELMAENRLGVVRRDDCQGLYEFDACLVGEAGDRASNPAVACCSTPAKKPAKRSQKRATATPMQIDETKFTRKRVMVTTRLPKFAVADLTQPWVMPEAEDGSGLTVALMGPDTPEARADAARMMKLWNDALDAR
ncbi:hypothetical protein J2793_007226 [Paraburkholderia caledonica]|uniref:FtsK gamma domain-containing protein n=2 Tax=Paraburkholderia caledonica TaxID=134536 RepID=A0AB73IP50_9BURK|nr:hypothetical protein [Paraburkholderia caledonica]